MPLFDPAARAHARRRAAAPSRDRFLLDRAFGELVERMSAIDRPLRRILLVGALDPAWASRLAADGAEVTSLEPSDDSSFDFGTDEYDAAVVVGALDTIDALPALLKSFAAALRPDCPLLGATIGGDTLPTLRAALIDADRASGRVAPRAHPRIDAQTLAGLLGHAGLAMPVVDVDRVEVRYRSLGRLVGDLRAMAATNVLAERSRSNPGKAWRARLEAAFAAAEKDGATTERFEWLHFLAWSAAR